MFPSDETKRGKQKQEEVEPSGCNSSPDEVRLMMESIPLNGGEEQKGEPSYCSDNPERRDNYICSIRPTSYCSDNPERRENYICSIRDLIAEKQRVSFLTSDFRMYRVPDILVKENPEAYIPHLVSIGPFHHDQHHLQPMEASKMQHFKNFLLRKFIGLDAYIEAVVDLEKRAHQCYPEVKIKGSFTMMLLVDGCFILELLESKECVTMSTKKWNLLVSLDLLLLENQLPFFVLEALYQTFYGNSDYEAATQALRDLVHDSFLRIILEVLVGEKDMYNYFKRDIEGIKPKHLLDFLRQFLIPETSGGQQNIESKTTKCMHFVPAWVCQFFLGDPSEEDNNVVRIRYATELQKASVKFEKNKNPKSLLDIKFDDSTGVLTIPGLKIDCGTEIIIRNLVVYEQYTDDYSYITEYVAFLVGLIDSDKDVELLQKSGIIETIIGDPKEVFRLFNNLLKDVAVYSYYTVPVRRQVEQYYNIPWHKWKASLMLNYFNTPWSFISVVAAIILLLLTFTQTFYTAWPYIK